MKLATAFGILTDLKFSIQVALRPTLSSIWASPSLVFRPWEISRIFMANLWKVYGPGVDEGGRPVKEGLITPYAYGTVLDIGAGHGHTVHYLNRERVTKYIALEPNTLMHPHIREVANKAGFTEQDDTLIILGCGAEDTEIILAAHGGRKIDTIISILTLCTIPNPRQTITTLVNDVLASGGQLLYYEHVLSPRKDVAWWQKFWAPIWSLSFDGCRMDRPSHLWVEEVENTSGSGEVWRERQVWGKPEEPEEHLFWHRVGRYIKN